MSTSSLIFGALLIAAGVLLITELAFGDPCLNGSCYRGCGPQRVLADSPLRVQPVLFGRRLQTFQHGYHLGRSSCGIAPGQQAAPPSIISHGGHQQHHFMDRHPSGGSLIQPQAVPYSSPQGCPTGRWTQAGPRLIHFHGNPAAAPARVWHNGQYWVRDRERSNNSSDRWTRRQ